MRQSGTYWYHSHSGMQEQTGLYGEIVVEPRAGERIRADGGYLCRLSDRTDDDPIAVLAKLKVQNGYYDFNS